MADNSYKDGDLVYVDPEKKAVIKPVEWGVDGTPKKLEVPSVDEAAPGNIRRKKTKRFYPWGTYKTMKKVYGLEGKEKETVKNSDFDTAIQKAASEAYWD